ncbi:MAG TPA: chromosome partitioning protein [Rhodoglobus sp.]|nr:chromosome partitioning protein [Rhodoglobus sp.]
MTDTVATYPRIVAVVDTATGGTVSIDGRTTPVEGVDEQAVRKEIHALVTATAIELHRPVRLTTRDSLGEQQFAVHPDGRMEALTPLDEASAVSAPAAPVADQPPAAAPAAPMTRAEAKRPTLDDFLQSRPPAPVGPATMGWQALVRRLTAGLVSPRPSEFELAHRSAIERVQRSLRGPRTVVVINPKGGAHKTTATLLLAATFGTHRGGSTLAWDNNETRGTLGWRAQPARHQNTAVDLLRDLDRFNDVRNARVGDLDNYTRLQGSTQFDVLASDEDAAASSTIDAAAFNELHATLSRFYRVIVVDTGNNMRASNWEAAVAAADQLVIVSTVREDTAASAAWLVDGLTEKGHETKVRQAVTVLASPAKVADPQLHDRLHSHFNSLTRAVLDVPHDPALVDGGTLNFDALSAETREAWLQVTATVADGL